jgi:hypothetical protein
MLGQPGTRDASRLFKLAGSPVFLGELRKRNRRRILEDPASKVFNPLAVRHEDYGIAMVAGVDLLVRP